MSKYLFMLIKRGKTSISPFCSLEIAIEAHWAQTYFILKTDFHSKQLNNAP